MTMNKALNSSVKMDWQTPENVLELVRKVGPIGLDPCTTRENPTGALALCSPDVGLDGLKLQWAGNSFGALVYVNPPYGRALGAWVDKCIQEAKLGAEIILLVPSRTDTRWWHKAANEATCCAFWKGRMTFKGAPSTAPFPTCLFYFGQNWGRFNEVFGDYAFLT